MKTYPAYKESGNPLIGEVPEKWVITKLKRVTAFHYGNSLPKDNREDGKVPVYGSNGITGFHTEAITKSPCIIIGRKGSFGKINYSDEECFPIDTTFFVDCSATQNNIRWLYYLLATLRLDAFSKDSAVPGLNREEAYERVALLPLLEEQQAIADFLDRKTAVIDTLIAKKERQIELLQEQRTAVINHAVTKGLNPHAPLKDSGISWLGPIPAHWDVTRIKYVTHQIIDTEHKTVPYYEDGDYLVVRTSNVRDGKLMLEEAKYTDHEGFLGWTRRGVPKPGDILFTREAPAGEACIVPYDLPLCMGQRMVLFRVNHKLLNSQFGIWSIYGGAAATFISLLSQGSTVAHFNMSDIANLPLLLPPRPEQTEIAEKLAIKTAKTDHAIDKAHLTIKMLQEYRTAVIAAAVTGKIDVRPTKHRGEP